MNQTFYSLGEVGRLLSISPHRIAYAITATKIPEPAYRHANQRCFTKEDVERVIEHFGVENPFEAKSATQGDQ
jgi:2,4-dienoyl-CoA reductase-like NADH-dependent reductase (Old Yellow Enzyme family)